MTSILKVSAIVLCVGALLMFILDGILSVPENYNVRIIDRHYEAEHNSSGTGIGVVGGETAVIYTNEYEDEKFLLMAALEDGSIVTAKTSAHIYYTKAVGGRAVCEINYGRWSGINWGCYIVK